MRVERVDGDDSARRARFLPPIPQSPNPPILPVLYLDNHLLVVVKPAGMLSQADRTGDADVVTLGKAFLKQHFDKPGEAYLGLVHRLDRPASGVMVLATTSKAARRLVQQFKERRVEKRYVALVEGHLQGGGTVVDHLVKERGHVHVVPPGTRGAKRAELRWRALHHAEGLTLVEVALVTGRAHQVRVQLAALGTPLLGDFRYGARRELDGRNLALHACRLTLEHPTLREARTFAAHPPPTWPDAFAEKTQRLAEAYPSELPAL